MHSEILVQFVVTNVLLALGLVFVFFLLKSLIGLNYSVLKVILWASIIALVLLTGYNQIISGTGWVNSVVWANHVLLVGGLSLFCFYKFFRETLSPPVKFSWTWYALFMVSFLEAMYLRAQEFNLV